ncbi:hypothetical protein [Moheibacter lacus]|uniref:Uncharacterized protein n=1 Tax=Moheibacter lacus TaxID=2745851 RepID=A0A838ZIX2_9FLAO|nr:hypothetical protein [Moheibacter lacus]MBA5628304.1 hypothetical protein [Moheibacter lacus]
MEKQLKLIWDFRGPDAQKTAEHHEIHLKEFIQMENLKNQITGVEKVSDVYTIVYLVVNENEMISVRDRLLPHRGEWYEV